MTKNPRVVSILVCLAAVTMVLACFSGADVPSESANDQEEFETTNTLPKWTMSEDEIKDCIHEFQEVGRKKEGALETETGKPDALTTAKIIRSFDSGWGPEWRVDTDCCAFFVAEEASMVVSVLLRDQQPEPYWGPPITTWAESEAIKKRSVRITENEAVSSAHTFVIDHWGPQALDGLGEWRVTLSDTTDGWVYSIWWSNAYVAPVVFGKRVVRIEVNAATGAVFHAAIKFLPAPSYTKIDTSTFRKTVETEFAELPGLKVISLRLCGSREEDGTAKATWHGQITFKCDEELLRINPYACQGIGDIEMDANTGEILIKSAE